MVSAYGIVARPRSPVDRAQVERALRDYALRLFPGAAVAVAEEVDRGSLVSPRPERFAFLDVVQGDRRFAFCRFRGFDDGLEFVFNLSDSGRSAAQIERDLTRRLPLALVRSERL